jgi:hypothetical protein
MVGIKGGKGMRTLVACALLGFASVSWAQPKEKLVECTGTTIKNKTSRSPTQEPFHQVYRITDEAVTIYDRPTATLRMTPFPEGAGSDEAAYRETKEGLTWTLTLYKKTGRFRYEFAGSRIDVTEGECKKFVPNNVFE